MNKFYFPLLLAIAALGVACNPDDKNDTPEDNTVSITEESLKGTWEGGVTADFAQGYPQNWRIEFDGKNYTTWHTHQTAGSINDDEQGLKTPQDPPLFHMFQPAHSSSSAKPELYSVKKKKKRAFLYLFSLDLLRPRK